LLAEGGEFLLHFVKILFEGFSDDVTDLHGHSPDKRACGDKKKGEGGEFLLE
jgi:hypothetical protein